ncbi:antitoxin of toxin-antitoxin stability system [Parahaliea maris]|uniref:Antitoxin of toxin-antitoxin stability system n=1 Tax=Parahaliea maris TaxID=2716870 RepID=A0A5C9A5V0_9GAMM|nr:antitoxin of toxin-antitoxin stability system [Parahaliea maris]TXS96188.1 antitoxin of toxin-antitoxin stability system [Parahaliea maris]
MNIQALLAEETISITKLRSQLAKVLQRPGPVAVLSNNETAGYVINAEVFARLVAAAEKGEPGIRAQFQPTSARLREITGRSAELLANASPEQLDEFEAH